MSERTYGLAGPARPGTSLVYHILERQRLIPGASGDFTELFQQITLATKTIHSLVRRAGLVNVIGATGTTNVQGEVVQKLDEFANQSLIKSVEAGGHVCVMASEENDEIIPVPPESHAGKYVLLFDPLDGSGNIDINASIGTIFAIFRRKTEAGPGTIEDVLQRGRDMVAAGYVVYGSSMMLVYSTGQGVYGFTYDPTVGEYFLSHDNIRIPERGDMYSINEGNYHKWPEGLRKWADWIKSPDKESGRPYGLRYIGAMVADFHRTLLRGGLFCYPGDVKKPLGKLRLLYEANPLAFIAEAAGGAASNGSIPVLDVVPTELHQRSPLFIGSRLDVENVVRFVQR